MKDFINSIPERLKSRKLWLTVGGFITFVASGHYNEALALVLAYLGVEGAKDFKNA